MKILNPYQQSIRRKMAHTLLIKNMPIVLPITLKMIHLICGNKYTLSHNKYLIVNHVFAVFINILVKPAYWLSFIRHTNIYNAKTH